MEKENCHVYLDVPCAVIIILVFAKEVKMTSVHSAEQTGPRVPQEKAFQMLRQAFSPS